MTATDEIAAPAEFARPPMSRARWLRNVAFGSGARVFALGSQFVVLVILSRIVDQGTFGDLMIVFALYRIVSLGLGMGLGSTILYHIGRSGGDHAMNIRLHRSVTVLALAVSGVTAAAFIGFNGQIAEMFSKPGVSIWLVQMAPFVIFSTLNFVAMGSLEGRSRINSAIVLSEVIPNGFRLLALPVIALLHLPPWTIAHVMWIALALPWAMEARHLFNSSVRGMQRLTGWDIRYATLYAANTAVSLQLQGIDMIVVGALFDSKSTAAYAISSRLATLFPFFQQIILRNFAPRAGALLSSGNLAQLNKELATNKRWSVLSVCALTGAILVSTPILLPLFGNYIGSIPLLIALAAPPVVRSLFAGGDAILRMSGRAGYSFAISCVSAVFLIAIPVLTHGWLGIPSIAAGMMASAVVLNPAIALMLKRHGFTILQAPDLPIVALGIVVLAAATKAGGPATEGFVAGAGMLAVAIAFYLMDRRSNRADKA